MSSMTIYRIVHALGHVELRDPLDAAAYRDSHHPGASIIVISRTITEEDDGTRTETDEVLG